MKKVVAIVGMPGSGKSEVARAFEEHGFKTVRFGDTTDGELSTRGLDRNEENERYVRQRLRGEHGMAAYARLNLPRIDGALESANVVINGLYSWEEYLLLKEYYGERLTIIAVWSAPSTRYRRLATRRVRPLTSDQAASRDRSEIENLNKGGPVAMADFTVLNEGSLGDLRRQVEQMISAPR